MNLSSEPEYSDSSIPPHPVDPVAVLVVESHPTMRAELAAMVASDPALLVVAAVGDVGAALEVLARRRVQVVLLEQSLPGGSREATRRIMHTHAVPIVWCFGHGGACDQVFRAMETGAVACVNQPHATGAGQRDESVRHMCLTLRLMSEVKVVRRWRRGPSAPAPAQRGAAAGSAFAREPAAAGPAPTFAPAAGVPTVVGIGASTGGPMVLRQILATLPQPFPAPILVVQHMAHGFMPGMVDWLSQSTGTTIELATQGVVALPGRVYVAPDRLQMGVSRQGQILLAREETPGTHQPSVAWLFRSMAENLSPSAIGVLLTGMGRDGAAELRLMKDRGSITIAQDRDTSTVHGMPGEAIALGGASYVLAADKIAGTLASLLRSRSPVPQQNP